LGIYVGIVCSTGMQMTRVGAYSLVSDIEIGTDSDDKLSYGAYAEGLADLIALSKTHFVLGVYGGWGTGKSSLMRLIQAKLQGRAELVWFDPWLHDSAQEMRLALIQQVTRHIEKKEGCARKAQRILESVNWLRLGGMGLSAILHQPDINLEKVFDQCNAAVDETEAFRAQFEGLVDDYTSGGEHKLVVFIDDMDRCSPDACLEILEVIRLLIGVRQTVFVMAVDQAALKQAVSLRYPGGGGLADNYLDKVIQFGFDLPPLRQDDMRRFINAIAPDPIRVYAGILASAGANPRRIKRCINEFVLETVMGDRRKIDLDERVLAKLAVLRLRWPRLCLDLMAEENWESETSKAGKRSWRSTILQKIKAESEKRPPKAAEKKGPDYLYDPELVRFLRRTPAIWRVDLRSYFLLAPAADIEAEADALALESAVMSSPRASLKSILDNQLAAAKLMEIIGERNFKVVRYYVGAQGEYEHTLEEVGTMFLVTPERIRQIVKQAASVAEAFAMEL
jgi:hypothetical protein